MMIRNWKAFLQARFVFTSSWCQEVLPISNYLFLILGFFWTEVSINLSSRPEWDQTSGWSLRRNVVTLDFIICHFIIIFVTVFFNPEPYPRWRGFILMPFSVRWFYFSCPLFTDLNVRVIGWTSSTSNSSRLGFLFFFKTI